MTAIVLLVGIVLLGPAAVLFGADTTSIAQEHRDEAYRQGWWPGHRSY